MRTNSKAICLLISMLLLAPVAWADIVINNGPNTRVASNGAYAVGGQYLIPDGDQQDGSYWAVMGLHALAYIPDGYEGSAEVNFVDQSNTFDKVIDLQPNTTASNSDTARFHMVYFGDVSANVYKNTTAGDAIAYANIGTGAADFAVPNGAGDCDNHMIGASGMLSFLALPQNARGNAGTDGRAAFSVNLIGESNSSGINSEVLEIQGITNGQTGIGGIADQDANNEVIGLAALGTLTFANDLAGDSQEGYSVTGSGMATFTTAATTGFVDPATGNVEYPDSDIQAKVTSIATTGGAWDGSTPETTTKQAGANDNVRSTVSGSTRSLAETFENGDIAASGSLIGDIAFHVVSPLTVPAELDPITFIPAMQAELSGQNDAFALLGQAMDNGMNDEITEAIDLLQTDLGEKAGTVLNQTNENNVYQLNDYMPTFNYITFNYTTPGSQISNLGIEDAPDIVALNVAATGAYAVRTQNGSDNHVSAEAWLGNVDASAVARQDDRVVSVSKDDLKMASGAHLQDSLNITGSIGFVGDVAAQDYNTSLLPTTGQYGIGSVYGAVTLAPTATDKRWDDAGTLLQLKSATMETRIGSNYVRQTDGPIDAITWISGNDINPKITGQSFNSTSEDSISGNPSSTVRVDAPLLNLEWPQGRATVWNTATGTLQI